MAHITNLKVAFRKTIQPREYESESAEVEFSVALDEDDAEVAAAMTADVLEDARDQVFKALGKKKPSKTR